MITLKVGVKGTGKTKMMMDEIHQKLEESKGVVICIEKGEKLTYQLSSAARLINTEYYEVKDAETLYGFVCGIFACNYDITELFIDSALKICGDKVPEFESFMHKLDKIAAKVGVDCFITASLAEELVPQSLKKYTA